MIDLIVWSKILWLRCCLASFLFCLENHGENYCTVRCNDCLSLERAKCLCNAPKFTILRNNKERALYFSNLSKEMPWHVSKKHTLPSSKRDPLISLEAFVWYYCCFVGIRRISPKSGSFMGATISKFLKEHISPPIMEQCTNHGTGCAHLLLEGVLLALPLKPKVTSTVVGPPAVHITNSQRLQQ